jgi:hypothetical protein
LKEVRQGRLDHDGGVVEVGEPLKFPLEPRAALAQGRVGVLLGLALDGDPVLEADDGVVPGRERLHLGAREAVRLLLAGVDGHDDFGRRHRKSS